MKVFIDSPLPIYLNTLTDSSYRIVYKSFYIETLTKYKPFTDILVFNELVYVSKKKYNIPYSVSIEFIQPSILPYVTVLNLGEEEYSYATKIAWLPVHYVFDTFPIMGTRCTGFPSTTSSYSVIHRELH